MNTKTLIRFLRQYPFAIVGSVVAIALLAIVLIRGGELAAAQSDFEDLQSKVTQIERNEVNAVGLDQDLKEIREVIERVDKRLIDASDTVTQLQMLYKLKDRSGITMGVPELGGRIKTGKATGILTSTIPQLKYSFRGPVIYEDLLDFVFYLQNSEQLFVVDRLLLRPLGNPLERRVNAELTFRALAKEFN